MAFLHSPGWTPPVVSRLKSTAISNGQLIGTYGLRYGSPDQLDIQGEWFDWTTDFGVNLGSPIPVLVNHGMPLCDSESVAEFKDIWLGPATLTKDTKGIWAETTLDLSDPFQEAIADLVKLGALSWSTGSVGHMVQKSMDGKITKWPIAEISLTPTPAEFRLPRIRLL